MEEKKFQMDFAGRPLIIEVGKLAKQASGAALVRYGDTAVFVTATGSKEAREDADFFPLTVDYEEKMYSVGKIPGGFIKREGKPPESATLFARLIDRPIRPLFPKTYRHDVHVVAYDFCVDHDNAPEIAAMIGIRIAVHVSYSLCRPDCRRPRRPSRRAVYHQPDRSPERTERYGHRRRRYEGRHPHG